MAETRTPPAEPRASTVVGDGEIERKYESSDAGTRNEVARKPDDEPVSDKDREFYEKYGTYDRYEITEEDCYDELGFSFPEWK